MVLYFYHILEKNTLAHLALFAVALIYAANFSIAKIVLGGAYIGPSAFIVCRVSAALFLFVVYHAIFVKEKISKEDIKPLFWCAVFGVATNQLFFFLGLALTTPIHAALIMTTTPIVVLLVEAFMKGVKITSTKIIGILLAFGGAIFIILSGKELTFNQQTTLGDLFVFANAVSYSVYLVKIKPFIGKYHPITINRITFMFGLLMVLPFGLVGLQNVSWHTYDIKIWSGFLYVLIFTTFFTYYFNAWAMLIVNPSVVGVYIYLQPLLTAVIALLAGSDQLEWNVVFAAVFIFFGVFLVSYKKKLQSR